MVAVRSTCLKSLCAAELYAFALTFAAVSVPAAPPAISQEQQIVHVLNRLGYGPRPGDVERVQQIGLGNYLQQQLHPEQIDDSAVDRKLARFDVLTLSNQQIVQQFREDERIRRERQRAQAEAARQSETNRPAMAGSAPRRPPLPNPEPSRVVLGVAAMQEAKIIRAVESRRQLYEVLVDFWSNHFNIDVHKGQCRVLKIADERDVIRAHVLGKFRDLLGASAKSPAMLFYLDNAQSTAPRQVSPVQQQRIRERQLQRNPNAAPMAVTDKPRVVGGINENYARELMELHTLGVDGGYTQKDVQEVARCFTGWTIDPQTGDFLFAPGRHDNGEKTVLGHVIPAGGGIQDGEQVLDILARHPSTAKFIATKLCRRLVADDPPAVIVDRAAAVFRQTDGDLRKVVEAIIYSPEFYSPAVFRAKIKSPFEFAVSSVRALDGYITLDPPMPLPRLLAMENGATFGRGGSGTARRQSLDLHIMDLGQPLFAYQAPTGYPEDSRKWVSTGALIARMNFALTLTSHNVLDALVAPRSLIQDADIDKPDLVLDRLNQVLLQGELTAQTRATLQQQALGQQESGNNTINVLQLTALMLGSPEFQRH